MINNIEKIFGALRSMTLSVRERANMRLQLQAHIHENPVRTSFGARVSSAFSDMGKSFESALNSQTFLTHPVFAACVLVLCISIGTSYAAEGALPGQALYAFKTRVNEPLQGVLAVSPAAKAEWSAQLTDRRLQEAEELAATNQLSPVATADIETGLDAAVKNFNSNIQMLSKGDDVGAANAQSDFEASLNAHEVVLASLPTTQNNDTSRITSLVRKHAATITQNRSDSEAALTATDSPKVKTAALKQQKFAQDAINQAQLFSTATIDTEAASSVSAITQEATNDMNAGDSEAKHGKWGKAYGAFQDAIRKMKETQDGMDTRNWLKNSFGIGIDIGANATSSASTTDKSDSNSDNSDNSGSSSKSHGSDN